MERRFSINWVSRLQEKIWRCDSRGFFPLEEFSWVPQVEADWEDVLRELNSVWMGDDAIPNFHEVSSAQEKITNDDKWKTFFFHIYGHRVGKNCARCPATERLLSRIPGMTTAMFSILYPGKHIPEHQGKHNGYLRYHLGLIVPKEASQCRIRVNDNVRHWEAGKSIIFDDLHPHEVWNETQDPRVVLFVDFLRPLPWRLRWQNWVAHRLLRRSDLIRDAVENAIKL